MFTDGVRIRRCGQVLRLLSRAALSLSVVWCFKVHARCKVHSRSPWFGAHVFFALEVPHLQFIVRVFDIPAVSQRWVPTEQTVQQNAEIPQMQFLVLWFAPLRSCSDKFQQSSRQLERPQISSSTSSWRVSEWDFCSMLRHFFGLRPH